MPCSKYRCPFASFSHYVIGVTSVVAYSVSVTGFLYLKLEIRFRQEVRVSLE